MAMTEIKFDISIMESHKIYIFLTQIFTKTKHNQKPETFTIQILYKQLQNINLKSIEMEFVWERAL